jgi:hypothetical protein
VTPLEWNDFERLKNWSVCTSSPGREILQPRRPADTVARDVAAREGA